MKYEDKIRMLTVIARANGMMSALACMEGATITKRLTLTLDDQLDHMDEVLSDLFKEAVKDDEDRIRIMSAEEFERTAIDHDQ